LSEMIFQCNVGLVGIKGHHSKKVIRENFCRSFLRPKMELKVDFGGHQSRYCGMNGRFS
jgi:hypothetical protein